MKITTALKALAAKLGIHVVRQSQNPMHTLLGIDRARISTILDIGANSGQFAQFARSSFPGASIFCFEPLPEPYRVLSAWASQQSNISTFNFALGESDGMVEMYMHSAHTPSSSLLETTELSSTLYPVTDSQTKVGVAIRRLDDVCEKEGIPFPGDTLVKLDVQGFELPVIRGGTRVLGCARYCIIEVCLDRLYKGQSDFREIFLELSQLGFRYHGNLTQTYADDGHVIYLDALFVR